MDNKNSVGWAVGSKTDKALILRFDKINSLKPNPEKDKPVPPSTFSKSSRKRSISPLSTVSKRRKMDMDDIKKIVSQTVKETIESTSESTRLLLETHKTDILEKMTEITGPIEKGLNDLTEIGQKRDQEIKGLTDRMDKMKEEVKEELREEFKNKIDLGQEEAMKMFLMKEIEKSNINLILYGFKGIANKETVTDIFKTMEIDGYDDLRILKVAKLGKDKGDGKVPPVLVTLSDPYARNNVIKAGRNLPKGMTIDKDMPACYREAHKRMKKKAWKLRTFEEVKTLISFSNHKLQLRYREEGKSFSIIEEYSPRPSELSRAGGGDRTIGTGPPSTLLGSGGSGCYFAESGQFRGRA